MAITSLKEANAKDKRMAAMKRRFAKTKPKPTYEDHSQKGKSSGWMEWLLPGTKDPKNTKKGVEGHATPKNKGSKTTKKKRGMSPGALGGKITTQPKVKTKKDSKVITPTPRPKKEKVKATAANTKNYASTLSLQKRLIKMGAKIKADGIMGPKTRAAIKKYIKNPSTLKNKKDVKVVTKSKIDPFAIKGQKASKGVSSKMSKSEAKKFTSKPSSLKPFKGSYNQKTHKLVNIQGKTYVAPKSYTKPASKTNPSLKKFINKFKKKPKVGANT
tara:strand:+ start:2111 stop:2926 length:816 start_codon:yes stop_codon:yes gene_type:complete